MTLAGAVILAAIAITLQWYDVAPRFVACMLLIVGIGSAAVVAGFLGGFGHTSVGGASIFSIVAVASLVAFYQEGIKGNRRHRIRTPIVAVVCGVAFMTATGSVFVGLQNFAKSSTATVDQAVVKNLNSK